MHSVDGVFNQTYVYIHIDLIGISQLQAEQVHLHMCCDETEFILFIYHMHRNINVQCIQSILLELLLEMSLLDSAVTSLQNFHESCMHILHYMYVTLAGVHC